MQNNISQESGDIDTNLPFTINIVLDPNGSCGTLENNNISIIPQYEFLGG